MDKIRNSKYFLPALVTISLLAFTILVLKISGRNWLAPSGTILFWYGDANGPETSQHLLDPYSFTHFLHGVVFSWLIYWFGKKVPLAWQLICAIALESSWEVIENSETVINRYREATFALGYYGDSILNSMSDIFLCSCGFLVASKLGFKKSLVLFILVEALLIFWIKDSLIINVIMLISPIDAIKAWQAG